MTPFAGFWPPDGNPTPATPGGSWKATSTGEFLTTRSSGGSAEQAFPRSCCVAARAALNKGQASSAPSTVLPPLSVAMIAWIGEDAAKCHDVPVFAGNDVPTGVSAKVPLPSAPKVPLHVQPVSGPTSISLPAASL